MRVVDVILPLAVEGSFTYLLPASEKEPEVQVGQRVVVPLGKKKEVMGVVETVREAREDEEVGVLREVLRFPEEGPLVTAEQMQLWQWIARYYMCSLGEVMRAALPNSLRQEKESRRRKTPDGIGEKQTANALNEEQTRAVEEIYQAWEKTPTVLLFGVTSSGKTEVYIHLAEETIRKGKKVLYLVPEIALTTQLTDRLRRVFGERLGVYHSRFTDRERETIYKNVLAGDRYDVVLGVRSSLFLPFRDLGLIIVDEEHDTSYKQQDPAPRYHARTVALMLGSIWSARTLLGTATPSVETYYNALQGKYGLVEMKRRYAGLALPAIHLLDLQRAYKQKKMEGHLSLPLVVHMREQLEAGKQVLLFQNRRGYNSFIECPECGYVPKCVNCDISLTEHKPVAEGLPSRLVCHYCGYSIPAPSVCPECGKGEPVDRGFGTEKIEEEAKTLFPEARIARMDTDTTHAKDAHEKLIRRFADHEIDILVGTQMITKGLHFKDVSLVAVLKADAMLNQPDFRAQERAYQMLEQVSGRAGRAGTEGHVILQTSDIDNPLFKHLQRHDYEAMYAEQIEERKSFRYPPFYRIIGMTLRHREQSRLEAASRTLHDRLKQVFGTRCSEVIVPAVGRVQNLYIRQLTLKIEASASYAKAKEMLEAELRYVKGLGPCKGTLITLDVDPM
ncbi:MAG: primosomal protein N' [Paludibacteraceae bacterium]|nr:primosomal protein N' [Paludibacteraceae bacterium]